MRCSIAFLAALLFFAQTGAVQAHPHVFIDVTFTPVMDETGLIAIKHSWVFDEMFSSTVLADFDGDGDGQISEEENPGVEEGAFNALSEYDYYNYIYANGKRIKTGKAKNFKASVNDESKIVYSFELPVTTPVTSYTTGTYDPEYYIDYAMTKDVESRTQAKLGAWNCTVKNMTDSEHPIYMGMVEPKVMDYTCTK